MAYSALTNWRSLIGCALIFAIQANASLIVQLKVIEGDGAEYRIGSRATRSLTVLVTDETGHPVSNAVVSFRLPDTGATGVFNSGLRSEIVNTSADGRATVTGVHWNNTAGPVEVRITAMKDQARAGIISTVYLAETAPSPRAESVPKAIAAAPAKHAVERTAAPAPRVSHVSKPAATAALAAAPAAGVVDLATPDATASAPKVVDLAAPNATAPAPAAARIATPTTGGEGEFKAPHKGFGKWLLIIAAAGGAAAAGMALGGSHSASAAPAAATMPTTIGVPTITVGHP